MPSVNEPIAVVGSGCRFPGESTSPSKLWELLKDPRDVQRKIDRFRADNFYNQDGHYHGASNVLDAYLLAQDVRHFDAQFFNIPTSEAEAIDPQQRLLMETVYESLETAGLSMQSLTDSQTSFFVGVMCDDFSQIVYGDSDNVPTLVAVHQAIQTLRSGESPVAVAAGTNLILGPTMFVAETNLNMLSATGRSRMWDAGADGYARGEGVGAVVMKTLSAALRDGDHIEYIIRETGINQDGKTPGITMPSSDMQAALIRETYKRAGLDLTKRSDRCQYFEAHGTGTKAGDPQEARAIREAFYAAIENGEVPAEQEGFEDEDVLYVGSIKTIIGHTEGTAGIAGLMKASLAIQNRTIPPNMLFKKLNPDLEPFYTHLKVPVQPLQWPELPAGVPRRASVNSFGFGGANAHAIIESYEPEPKAEMPSPPASSSTTPYVFVFSAASEKALVASMKSYRDFIHENPDFDPAVLAWSLFRRTAHKFRISFSAFSIDSLASQIDKTLDDAENKKDEHVGTRVSGSKGPTEILGIFTGQGAQWATMGRELIQKSEMAASVIAKLEKSLADLPDGPEWSLKDEIMASKEKSRIAAAFISQPLCTAVQVMAIDLLKQAGVRFSAVVGHSSGEIACAYASGFMSAEDAIRVAYYRGKFSSLASGGDGKRGAMIAAGTDMQDAIDLCSLPKLKGKAQLAASNSSASVTISGNADAIDLVEMVFQDESKFARKLKVDTAYHCFHMEPCSVPYVEALEKCGVQINEPESGACPWYSSVLGGDKVTMDMKSALATTYWRDNMLQTVLFSQALEGALKASGTPGLVIEVGPHPALKGPASLTIEEFTGTAVPYVGSLARGKDDALALADAMGMAWRALGQTAFDFQAFERAFEKNTVFEIAKGLPAYVWDHEKVIWNETRVSKAHRLRPHAMHDLLGHRAIDEVEGELRWRNYLKPNEIQWQKGHCIQGQMLFPAAGFAVMALEAARQLAPFDNIRLMELRNMSIHKGIPFSDESSAIETIFVLSNIRKVSSSSAEYMIANFGCDACLNKDVGVFTSMCTGEVHLTLGTPSFNTLPERPQWIDNWVNTDVEFFYDSLAALGYGYTGMFRGVTDLQRTTGGSRGTIQVPMDDESSPKNWVIHPATLDVAFQSIFAAVGAPGDGRLWTMHVPTRIDSITINPRICEISAGVEVPLPFDACIVQGKDNTIAGDVELYDEDGKSAVAHIQGLAVSPLTKPTAADDRETFAATTWGPAFADLVADWKPCVSSAADDRVSNFAERLSLFILRDLYETISAEEAENMSGHEADILKLAEHIVQSTKAGMQPTCVKQWLVDTWDILEAPAERMAKKYPQIRLCLRIKELLVPFVRGELTMEEELETELSWEEFYRSIPGFDAYQGHLAKLVDRLAFKHRNLKVLEIGAGRGSCAKTVLGAMDENFMSYTYTDVDPIRFETMRSQFPEYQAEKIVFKTLDIEFDVADQGFATGYYDLVVASNSISSSAYLETALQNIRTLIRPGGYLALLEPTSNHSVTNALAGCIRADWFVGADDGREYSPAVSQKTWDDALRSAGFSGIDTATPQEASYTVPFSVMCSMAVNKQMEMIRDPLAFTGQEKFDASLLIIGGRSVESSRLLRGLNNSLRPFFKDVINVETVVEVDDDLIAMKPTVINLMELDEPFFRPFTEEKFKAVVKLCEFTRNMLWITVGSRGENPYMNMMVGVGRCLVGEMPSLRLQFLNFDGSDRPTPTVVAHHLMRLHLTYNFAADSIKIGDPLYTIERELSIQDNALIIPRYLPVEGINDRVNSEKRRITHDKDQSKTAVGVTQTTSSYKLVDQPQLHSDGLVTINVSKCLLDTVQVGASGCFFVAIGTDVETGNTVIALSEANQSIISVPEIYTSEVLVEAAEEADALLHVAAQLLAYTITEDAMGVVLVHEPTASLARSISQMPSRLTEFRNKTVVMTSISPKASGVRQIHPLSQDRVLAKAVPNNVSVFFDLSETAESKTVANKIERRLAAGCEIKRRANLVGRQPLSTGVDPRTALSVAVLADCGRSERSQEHAKVVPASAMWSEAQGVSGMRLVDWRADSTVPVAVIPADETIRFRSDKTYFMVGLTGELGLQLTKWMVKRGARYIALSSRKPKVDPEWLEYVESEGATVRLYEMDVTSRSSVRSVHKQLCKEMPPVAGVANGAMILIDGLFANKTHAEFDKTLRPKVDGTVFLDEVFGNDDLDFFMVFSSLACVSGNMGQTAYAAANAFMCSLIAGRRMRGLAGSAINMPGIVGLGYLNRDARKLDRLKNVGYVNISEWEFYQFFSEAVTAGRPDSGMNPEITAGLQRIDMERNPNPPIWANTPRFNWLQMVKPSGEAAAESDSDGPSVRSRLGDMTDVGEVRKLLLEGLLATLYSRLNMNPEERGITPDTAIVELGVDSLLAVDMRAWFTKELDLDMPVLKLLGGATVNELVDDAVARLSPDLVPKLKGDGANAEAAPADESQEEAAEAEEAEAEEEVEAAPTAVPAIVTDLPEETLTAAPIDLPSPTPMAESQGDALFAAPHYLRRLQQGVASSTDSLTDAEDIQNDGHDTPGTPATTNSDFEGEKEPVDEVEEAIEEADEGEAKLFSHVPEIPDSQPEMVKKEKMSYGTSRFWFLMQYLEDPTTFNLMCHLKFTGPIRLDDADRSVIELGNRHEVFRTCFYSDPERLNEPTMGVLKETPLRLERRRARSEADVEAEKAEMMSYEFKIDQGETIRIKMVSLDDLTHHVIFGFHHIVMDGFSFNMLLPEINKLYDAEPMDPIVMPFTDFAAHQREQVASGALDGEFAYWREMYGKKQASGEITPDYPDVLPLFSVAQSSRKNLDNYEFEESNLLLDTRTVRQIKAQCRRHKITSFHFFLGVLRTFLFRHINIDDLVIGIADANRSDKALDKTMGFMLNLLPLRFKSENNDKNVQFKDVALEARTKAYDALAHSKVPFDVLLEKLDIPRSADHSPLFQVWMDYRPFTMDAKPKMFGGEVTGSQSVGRNGYDLTLDVNEVAGSEIRVSFRTQKYLYSKDSTQLLFDSYIRLVKAFAASFDTPVNDVPMWAPRSIEAAKTLGRGPQLKSAWPETLSHRIADVATQKPQQEALKDGYGATLTYQDMQQRVQAISDALVKAGVQRGSKVAVFQQPSVDWVCSLLAIWHAGGTYIPMDLRSSLARLAVIAKAARPTAILCHAATKEQAGELSSPAKALDVSSLGKTEKMTESKARAADAAAVLYTSGSTGTPKGVILPHVAFRNTIEGLTSEYNIGAERVLQQSAYTFDFSLDQMMCGLVNGGSVFVATGENRMDPAAITNIIESEKITYTRATPSEYAAWISLGAPALEQAGAWKFAWGGGELMPMSLKQAVEGLGLEGLKLYNSYGPAESITCTKTEIPYGPDYDEDDIPAGYPLPNYSVYIVDHNMELVPQGVGGEIVIGGPSVARGYLNNEKLSDSKFIANSYAPSNFASADGRIVYRTGDVGHLRKDGALMFHGRIAGDSQVKIRGMRIELEDVESTIVQAAEGAVHAAVVSLHGDLLVAHVQFAPGGQYAEEGEQNAFLRSMRFMLPLPIYMIPAVFIPLARIPVNAHGKIDRAAVQQLEIPRGERGRTAEDLTETERALVELWRDAIPEGGMVGSSALEISDQTTFFELGGNSLLLAQLQAMISTRFNAKLSLVDLFGAATLGSMAAKIDGAEPADNIDWEAETALDEKLAELAGSKGSVDATKQQQKIVVTGSTGFLGRKLVQALAASDAVAEIHCVAVRDRQRSHSHAGPAAGAAGGDKKIRTYAGDLTAPRLGLDAADFDNLASGATMIVHAATHRALLDSYGLLKEANFGSTRALVELAAPRRVPFHLVSSGAVASLELAGEKQPPRGGSGGYVACKWASETYLAAAASRLALPVAIHRILAPEQEDEDAAAAGERTSDLVRHLRDLASQMRALPTVSGTQAQLDMIPVDGLVRRMVASMMESRSSGGSSSSPEHVSYRASASIDTAQAVVEIGEEFGSEEGEGDERDFTPMPVMRWLSKARNSGLQWQITSHDNIPFGNN
ncbi:hypothetical protein GGR56DRAFT_680577 [Xylariaceae sp. FL0804]|nr:hypothetical protein GGR56DRAFT_680577 [Xylariaceae sp. FL0804]